MTCPILYKYEDQFLLKFHMWCFYHCQILLAGNSEISNWMPCNAHSFNNIKHNRPLTHISSLEPEQSTTNLEPMKTTTFESSEAVSSTTIKPHIVTIVDDAIPGNLDTGKMWFTVRAYGNDLL